MAKIMQYSGAFFIGIVIFYFTFACCTRWIYTWIFRINEQIKETSSAVENTKQLNYKLENLHNYLAIINQYN